MNIHSVLEEVASKLGVIDPLRVFPYPTGTVSPPAGIVTWPERIDYHQTYVNGMTKIEGLPVVVVVGKATDRAANKTAMTYASDTGAQSVKVALEAGPNVAYDVLTVISAEFDVHTIAGVDYLAIIFTLDIVGSGQ